MPLRARNLSNVVLCFLSSKLVFVEYYVQRNISSPSIPDPRTNHRILNGPCPNQASWRHTLEELRPENSVAAATLVLTSSSAVASGVGRPPTSVRRASAGRCARRRVVVCRLISAGKRDRAPSQFLPPGDAESATRASRG